MLRNKVRKFFTATAIVALIISTIGVGSLFAQGPQPGDFRAVEGGIGLQSISLLSDKLSGDVARFSINGITGHPQLASVIVKLKVDSVASYGGGVNGLRATSPRITGATTLDLQSADTQRYRAYVRGVQDVFAGAVASAVPEARIINRYDLIIGGVSMLVPVDQVDALSKLPNVEGVYADQLLQLDTWNTPQFIGATSLWNQLGGQKKAGEHVIIGVIDTGVWPEHPSYSDPDPLGKPYSAPPASWSGTTCDFGSADPLDPVFVCNNKLIGAYRFMATYDVFGPAPLPGEVFSARDTDGHGTHTSSTAGGNRGVAADVYGNPLATISGIAPRAHIAAYKVCGGLPGIGGCFGSDSAAAIQQAIADGVNVINFSISGGNNPYSDIVSLAFLDAYNAGIFVAASAGNTGPGANTVNHREPWVTTVAASTHDKELRGAGTINLTANGGVTATLTGFALDNGLATPSPVVLSSAAPYSNDLCGAPAAPGTFTGKIVACKRGTFALVTKVANVKAGGAVGAIIYNPAPQAIPVVIYSIPTVHIDAAEGTALTTFITSNTNVQATFSPATISSLAIAGDVMGAFSSRGGSGQTLGISKPDVTAPGLAVLAGYTPIPFDPASPDGLLFNFLQGTSMSSPHVAGSGALLKQLHPSWSPGQIKSALMMSANPNVLKENGVTPADPFDMGSGRIDLSKADVGLTISDTGANFLAHQNDLWNANYPSLYVPIMPGRVHVERTVHNESAFPKLWQIQVSSPSDVDILVTPLLLVGGHGNKTFDIIVDARNVPLGQTRFASLTFKNGSQRLRFPITIVRNQPSVTLDKTCAPASFPKNSTTNCTLTATNNGATDATVEGIDLLPLKLKLVNGSVVGGTQHGSYLVTFNEVLTGALDPQVTVIDGTGTSPAGYLPLSAFGFTPIAGMGDDVIVNFSVPSFTYAGQSYTTLGVSSNGYLVVGGGSGPDNTATNQNFPNPTRPNNVLAPFWSDLNPGVGCAVRIGILTDGFDDWIIVDWAGVPNFSGPGTNTFEAWIGLNTDDNPGEDISFVYGTVTGGSAGDLTVGAENTVGSSGLSWYFNGAGTAPVSGTELRVVGTPPAPGETHTVTYTAKGVSKGDWTNCVEMTADTFFGVNIDCTSGTVTP
jgi:hypothetical protein